MSKTVLFQTILFSTSREFYSIWNIRGAFNKFTNFFVQAFNIVLDASKFSILLLYMLWDDRLIFMISGSNEHLKQELEYSQQKPDCHSWWISKMQSGREEERYAIKFCFKLGKNAIRWKLDLLLWPRDRGSKLALPDRRRPEWTNPPLFWQHWHDLHGMGSHWTDS